MEQYDLIVFGGGNAITVATEVAAAGRNVALVEKGPLGGTCPHRGCIPSKLLIAHADVANTVRDAARFHLTASLDGIDADRVLQDVIEYTDHFDGAITESFPPTLTHYRAHGRFVDGHTLDVDGTRIHADRVVLATGSRPRVPPIPGLEGLPFWTSDEVFRVRSAPKSLTVIGGGFIGCELAYFFDGIGVETTIVHRGPDLLPAEDDEIRAVFNRGFKVPARLESQLTAVSHDGQAFRMKIAGADGRTETHESEALLVAIGRVPNTDQIDIEKTDLAPDARGYVRSDDHLQTGVEGIYSLGDVAGLHMFTHAANFEAQYLARQLIDGGDDAIDYGLMPHAVFTKPEIGSLGATEQQLRADGVPYLSASVGYDAGTKGRSIKEEHGLCKFLIDKEGAILGCHIVGAQASVLLHEVIPVVKWRNNIRSLTEIIHVHPSLPEIVRGAARKAAGML